MESLQLRLVMVVTLLSVFPAHAVEMIKVPFPEKPIEKVEASLPIEELNEALLDNEIPLTTFPIYGKLVAQSTGMLEFASVHQDYFPVRVSLRGLVPEHTYILTLNGNPERAGNQFLPTPVPRMEQEKYYDFRRIRTDGDGAFEGAFAIVLAPGVYDLRFYVKDTSDFKIVLFHDFFRFQISQK